MPGRVIATERAASLLRHLRERFGPLMFYQGGGCCAGAMPVCVRQGEIRLSSRDILFDALDEVPFYVGSESMKQLRGIGLQLDVADSFSLENREGVHFVTSSFVTPSCQLAGHKNLEDG